jgi:hypothetical protein
VAEITRVKKNRLRRRDGLLSTVRHQAIFKARETRALFTASISTALSIIFAQTGHEQFN